MVATWSKMMAEEMETERYGSIGDNRIFDMVPAFDRLKLSLRRQFDKLNTDEPSRQFLIHVNSLSLVLR